MGFFDSLKTEANKILDDFKADSGNISTDSLSYRTFLQDRAKFRQAGGPASSEFNTWDTPNHYFFRVFFHFYNGDAGDTDSVLTTGEDMSGFLGPAWNAVMDHSDETYKLTFGEFATQIKLDDGRAGRTAINANGTGDSFAALADQADRMEKNGDRAEELLWWRYNTAFSYLMMNDEIERAEMLYKFINLLSNINSESPWYWQKIIGLDEAVTRAQTSGEFSFKNERSKISIECLPDAADNRIGTLLDLYRAIVWSWQKKCEIVPANLRKFDMTVIIFSSPLQSIHHPVEKPELTDALGMVEDFLTLENYDYATLNPEQGGNFYLTSFRTLEFHNCEIDYNSAKYGYESVDNANGFEQNYKIDIFYDDVYEVRYNENMAKLFGDVVTTDTLTYIYRSLSSVEQTDNSPLYNSMSKGTKPAYMMRSYDKSGDDDFNAEKRASRRVRSTITGQLLGMATDWVAGKVNKLVLGNLFGFSLDRLGTQVNQLLEGQVGRTIDNIKSYGSDYNGLTIGDINANIHQDGAGGGVQEIEDPDNMFRDSSRPTQTVINMGNLFAARTIANT